MLKAGWALLSCGRCKLHITPPTEYSTYLEVSQPRLGLESPPPVIAVVAHPVKEN